jgi:uncharacterized protein
MKYLIAGLVIAAVLAWVARSRATGRARPPVPPVPPAGSGPNAKSKAAQASEMLRCAHCGIHLPRSEALLVGGQVYCSDEHRQRGPDHTHG